VSSGSSPPSGGSSSLPTPSQTEVARRRRWSWRGHVFPIRWFAGPLPQQPPAEDRIWRVLSQEEAEAWVRQQTSRATGREKYRVALENRHGFLVAEIDGQVVARRWVGTGWVYIGDPVWSLVRFPPGMGYFYGLYVDPAYRRRGISKGGVAAGLAYARAEGLTSCAVWMHRSNNPSLHNWSDLGVPCFDTTRIVVSHRGVWFPRSPWPRLGVTQVRWHLPPD